MPNATPAPRRTGRARRAPARLVPGRAPHVPTNEFVVDHLVDFCPQRNRYRVRWEGYDPTDDSWEPAAHIPRTLVNDFRRSRDLRPLPASVWNPRNLS